MAAVTDLVFVALVGIMDPLRAEAKDAVHVALNIGLVMRRERQAPWASPVFPYLGWIILGWVLTWAAVELQPLRRLLDTTSLSGGQWGAVIGLSLIAPAVVGIDKAIQLSPQRNPRVSPYVELTPEPVARLGT
jgi:P-type Ca2+ transporter type 2C